MKKILLYILPCALCAGLAAPAAGHTESARTAEEPDSAVLVDPELVMDADTVAYEESDWEDFDSTEVEVEDVVCPPDDELLAEFNLKEADFSSKNKLNANTGVGFSASLFLPGEVKKQSGYNLMASRILQSTLPDDKARAAWKTESLDKMLENKWKMVKEAYYADLEETAANNEGEAETDGDGAPYFPSASYRTNVMPAWRFTVGGGAVTYKVDDEVYLGGAHGMPYCYYLTLSERTDSLLGLTDIFKEESLPTVFWLIGEKLAARPNVAEGDEAWKPVAELSDTPDAGSTLRVAGAVEQYGGKWYPRPALTACGVLFSYAPYEKDCFAAGTVEILLPYDEMGNCMKFKP